MYMCTHHVYVHINIYEHTHTHTLTQTNARTHLHVYTYTHTNTYTHRLVKKTNTQTENASMTSEPSQKFRASLAVSGNDDITTLPGHCFDNLHTPSFSSY